MNTSQLWLSCETHHCPRSSVSLFECLDICPAHRQTRALLRTSNHRRPSAQPPSPSPACHHGSYCCTVAQLRWLVSALCIMEIVQLLESLIARTFQYKSSKTIYNNNNNTLIYIAPACRMTSEALAESSSRATECLTEK